MKSKVSSELWSWIATKPAVGITHFRTHCLQRDLRLLLPAGSVQNLIGRRGGWPGTGSMRSGMSPGKSEGLVSNNQYRNTVNETPNRPAQGWTYETRHVNYPKNSRESADGLPLAIRGDRKLFTENLRHPRQVVG